MIKKRKNWSPYHSPGLRMKPIEALKEITETKTAMPFYQSSSRDCIRLGEITLPDELKFEDIIISVNHSHTGYDGDECEVELEFSDARTISYPNPDYDKQMNRYLVDLEKWKQEKKDHETEVKEWKFWVKQEKDAELQRQLDHAEDLLKKHGRIK